MGDASRIEISGISVEVRRKDIKNLHLGVYPPGGRVRVAAPLLLGDDAVRLAVISRLGWIRRQQAAVEAGEAGSDARLQAARALQGKLKLSLEGEPPYDLFVRWKPLASQAIGWHPDLNDGVRMNIRPFATAEILRRKVKWDKDRGKEPQRKKAEYPWFWGWDEEKQDFAGGRDFTGDRWNDCDYTNEFKKKAKE